MQFEEVYDHIGHFGWYQLIVYIFCGIMSVAHGYQVSAMIYLGLDQDHFCKVKELANLSYDQQTCIGIPEDGDSFSGCEVYKLPWSEYSLSDFLSWNRTLMTANASTVQCNQWNHNRSIFDSTLVTQFDLVCGSSWYIQMASTAYSAGMLTSSIFSGSLSDKFGRLKTTIIGMFLHPALAIGATYSPNIQVFCFLRFVTGVAAFTAYLGGYVMITETVGMKYRTHASIGYNSVFSLGVLVYTFEAYFVRDHIQLQLVMAIPMFATIGYIWVFPESARWLHAKGRSEEAIKLLKLNADVNGKKLPPDFTLEYEEKKEEGPERGIIDLFRYPVFRKITLINYFIWFSNSVIYFGVGLNVASLVGDIFLNTFLTYIVEIPANTIAGFVAERYGRRKVLCVSFLIGGLCNLAVIPLVVTGELDWLLVTFTIIGRIGSSAAFATTFLITAELYPTEIRHVALGSCSTCSRVGNMLAPYVGSPMASVWAPLPSLIFGTFGLASAVGVMMLRETLNRPMPDRVEDVLNRESSDVEEISELQDVPVRQADLKTFVEQNAAFENGETSSNI